MHLTFINNVDCMYFDAYSQFDEATRLLQGYKSRILLGVCFPSDVVKKVPYKKFYVARTYTR